MRLLFKEVLKSGVPCVPGVPEPAKLSNDETLSTYEVGTLEGVPAVFRGVPTLNENETPSALGTSEHREHQAIFEGVPKGESPKATPTEAPSVTEHREHPEHREMAKPENNVAQSFSELMQQAAFELGTQVNELPFHHFEQWEIDSINAGTFWCGKRENNMLLEWAVFNLKIWMNE